MEYWIGSNGIKNSQKQLPKPNELTIFWDSAIQTDKQVNSNKQYNILFFFLIDMSVPANNNKTVRIKLKWLDKMTVKMKLKKNLWHLYTTAVSVMAEAMRL